MALFAPSGIMNLRGFRSAPVAPPSGIPVASTSSFVILSGYGNDGTFVKISEGQYLGNVGGDVFYGGTGIVYNRVQQLINGVNNNPNFILAPNSVINDDFGALWWLASGIWTAWYGYNDDGTQFGQISSNPSTNQNYIPTSNWTPPIAPKAS
jgi:hypothetical protein